MSLTPRTNAPPGTLDVRFGADSVRTVPAIFTVVLTSYYTSANGYSWSEIRFAPSVGPYTPTLPLSGDQAYDSTGSTTLAPGTVCTMALDLDQTTYKLWTASVISLTPVGSGSGSGSGSDCIPDADGFSQSCAPGDGQDVQGVRDEYCILGVSYITKGYLQAVLDAGKVRLSWYDLVTTANGCCPCGGSGSFTPACCPPGYSTSLAVALYGPFGDDCALATLTGELAYSGGVWEGTLTDGTLTAVAKLSCAGDGAAWTLDAVVTLADGTLYAMSVPLVSAGSVLGGLVGTSARTDCVPPDVEAAVQHPCPSGSGSGSGSGNCDRLICTCEFCPDGQTPCVTFSFAGEGDFADAPREWVLVDGGCSWSWATTPDETGSFWFAVVSIGGGTLTVAHYNGTLLNNDHEAVYFYGGSNNGCCGGIAHDPTLLPGDTGPVPNRILIGGLGPCGPCGSGSGGDVVTDCCPDGPVPVNLVARFTGVLGTLGGAGVVPLVWNGSAWQSSELAYAPCEQSSQRVFLQCASGSWVMNYGTLWLVFGATSGTCSPMNLTFTQTMSSAVCPGSSTAVVTPD